MLALGVIISKSLGTMAKATEKYGILAHIDCYVSPIKPGTWAE